MPKSAVLALITLVLPASVLAAGDVMYFPFDGNTLDASGHGNDGVQHNVSFVADCHDHANSACDFNGINSYVLTNDSSTLRPQTLTVACWVNMRNVADNSGTDSFITKYYGGSNNSFCLGVRASASDPLYHRLYFQVNGGGSQGEVILVAPFVSSSGDWHHVAGTYDGAAVALYIDGQRVATTPYSTPVHYDAGQIAIGAIYGGTLQRVDGTIDELHLIDHALSDAEVAVLAESCTPPNALYALKLISGGSLNGQTISASAREVVVAPGDPIAGSIALHAENGNCGGAVVPVEMAWSWGDHASSWSTVTSHVACGGADLVAPINLTAPTIPGTYQLVFGELAQQNGGWIASMSSWNCGPQIWDDGNDLVNTSQADLDRAQDKGWTFLRGWECDHYSYWPTGLAAIKVTVLDQSQYRLALADGGMLNGQAIDATHRELTVGVGLNISGTVALHAENDNCGGAIVPVEVTPTWGDHATSWTRVTSHVDCGGEDLAAALQMTAPTTPGTYYIVFGELAQLNDGWIASMSSWNCGTRVWNDGNDLADLTESTLSRADANGWVVLPGWECDHFGGWPTGLTWIKVTVVPAGQYRLHLIAGGAIDQQNVGPEDNEIEVGPNWPLAGTIRLHAENDNNGGAVVPVEMAWSWGNDAASSWSTARSHVPFGGTDLDVPINLVGPATEGTYYLIFGELAQLNGGWTSSMSSWSCGGGPVWNDGNDLVDLDPTQLASSDGAGWTMLPGWECDRMAFWPTGLAYVRVVVSGAADVAPTASVSGPGLRFANPYPVSSIISFSSPGSVDARVTVFDVAGRQVRTLFADHAEAGTLNLSWDGRTDEGGPAGTGVYFVRVESPGVETTRRLLLVR